MKKKLTTRQEYDETKAIVEALIAEATEKGYSLLKEITPISKRGVTIIGYASLFNKTTN